jgi:hypothetical protein
MVQEPSTASNMTKVQTLRLHCSFYVRSWLIVVHGWSVFVFCLLCRRDMIVLCLVMDMMVMVICLLRGRRRLVCDMLYVEMEWDVRDGRYA